MIGKVVWFDSGRGFGFLENREDGKQYFCHHSEICATGYRTLDRGASVEFDIGTSEHNGKPMAVKVRQTGGGDGSNSTATRKVESYR